MNTFCCTIGGAVEESGSETHEPLSNNANSLMFAGPGSVGDYSAFNNKLSIADFDLLKVLINAVYFPRNSCCNLLSLTKVLGKGSFGKVMLVKKKDDPSGTLYAMKTLRKAVLIKRKLCVCFGRNFG